tara:strand:- start:644 stop:814 length:171 start_codon:yes stop_codon:yes gene_type:complete
MLKKQWGIKMLKFLEAIDKLLIAILGLSVVEKREDDRRKKKQRKRKNEKRIGQRRD